MTPRQALLRHHLSVLWSGPRAWGFLLVVSLGLAAMTFFFSQTAEPDLLGKNAMLERMVTILIAVGMGLVALATADAFSGERERGTMEALLLAPVTGRDVLVAKGAAAMTWWIATVLIGIPFLWVLAFDPAGLRDAILVLAGPGTLLALFVAGLGLVFSLRSSDNKRSIAATFGILIALFGPGFVPRLKHQPYGETILRADPAAAVGQILDITVVKGQDWSVATDWFLSPVLAAAAFAATAWLLARRVALDPGVKH